MIKKSTTMQQVQLQIPEPCHENWEAMQAAEKGRFCLSCQKTVVDFSTMTDQQVLQYLQQTQSNTCGRFAPDQLNRPLTPQAPQRKRFWAKLVFQFLFPAFVFTQKARAQGFISVIKIQPPVATVPHTKPIPHQQLLPLRCKVTDSVSGEPLAFASVQIKGTQTGARTDSDGQFTISFQVQPKQVTLVVSSIDYTSKELVIKDLGKPVNIMLSPAKKELAEVVVMAYGNMRKINCTAVGTFTVTADSIRKTVPLIKRIADTLTGNNNISIYPNPVVRGNAIQLNMKKVKRGQYHLQLFSASGSLVQQELITVPAEDFNFQWDLGSQVVAGHYIINVMDAKGKIIHNGKMTVL